jgi:hypothetical protein
MEKPASPSGSAQATETWPGASSLSFDTKAASDASSPSASMSTPARALQTDPATPWLTAKRYTAGRYPMPWTTPSTVTVQRRVRDQSSETRRDLLIRLLTVFSWCQCRSLLRAGQTPGGCSVRNFERACAVSVRRVLPRVSFHDRSPVAGLDSRRLATKGAASNARAGGQVG